jgi:hypothetical protein
MTRVVRVVMVVVGVTASACASKRLPPGTPPPEYETRPISPWPPEAASSRAPAGSANALPPATSTEVGPPPPPVGGSAGSLPAAPSPAARDE